MLLGNVNWGQVASELYHADDEAAHNVQPTQIVDGKLIVYAPATATDAEMALLSCVAEQLQPYVLVRRTPSGYRFLDD